MHNFLTEQDVKKLSEEIEYRKVVTRKEINEDLKEARAHGYLSENYEYKAAKKERGKNESRIRYLERMIRTGEVITDTTNSDEVGLGKLITIKFVEDDFTVDYTIVTTVETDAIHNKISIESPLGKVIYKKKVGYEAIVSSPDGDYTIRIEKVSSHIG
jgi:transcription elongation factor GreA